MTLQNPNPIWDNIDAHIEKNVDYWIDQLARLCAQPSVSAQNYGIDECAELVATMLHEQGYRAEVMPSDGYPVVYGEGDGRSAKTLLFYLHYDVQPPSRWNCGTLHRLSSPGATASCTPAASATTRGTSFAAWPRWRR